MIKVLETILTRAATWPKAAQEELARAAREIEKQQLKPSRKYRASADELRAIDKGLAQADRGEFVSDAEMEKFFDRHGA
jgi:predicted transcriptional regulator